MKMIDGVLEFLLSPAGVASSAFLLEFILRVYKSEKPLSLLLAVKVALAKLGGIIVKAGDIVGKLSQFLDKISIQRVEAPKE